MLAGPLVWSAEPEKSKCSWSPFFSTTTWMRTGLFRSTPSSSMKRSASVRPSAHSATAARTVASPSSNRRTQQASTLSRPYLVRSSLTRRSASRHEPSWPRMSPSTSSGRAAVGGDQPLDVGVRLVAALVAHRRQMQALVEGLARLAGAASRHRAADVALVRDRAAEAEQLAVEEHRRDHAHVRRVRAAALVGMVDDEGVAFRHRAGELP